MDRKTVTGELKAREPAKIEWYKPAKKHWGEELLKNMSVAAALVLCVIALRAGAVPGAEAPVDAVLTAASDDTLLDDQLGKLSFVSSLFPEATLVFGETRPGTLALPVSGGVVTHTWNEAEPYMSWRTDQQEVLACMNGVVMGVYHGEDEELLVHLEGDNRISCIFGNLKETALRTGDTISVGDPVGVLLDGSDCVFEVRLDGVSVDPAAYLANVS